MNRWIDAVLRRKFFGARATIAREETGPLIGHSAMMFHDHDRTLIVAKALVDNQFLDCHCTRAFYKQILGVSVSWRDLQAVDEPLYKSLLWLLENDISGMEVCALLLTLFYPCAQCSTALSGRPR